MRIVDLGMADAEAVLALYRAAVSVPGSGLARRPDEVTYDYIAGNLSRPGLALGAIVDGILAGELHAHRLTPRQFAHVLTDLTVAVAPEFQGRGIGAALFRALFERLPAMTPPVTRVELVARSGNARAIALYERLGFVREGCFRGRVALENGTVEDDIPMAWIRP